MRVKIENLHNMCENNTHSLTRVRNYFLVNGHTVSDADSAADMVFVGGCTVTDLMRVRCVQNIVKMMREQPEAQFVVFGCLSAFPEELRTMAASELKRLHIVTYQECHELDRLIGARIPFQAVSANLLHGHVPYQHRIGPSDSYVLIAQGCGNDCSYCNIKKAKGYVASRSIEVIEEEVRELCRNGVNVITLLGDDCGSYGLDIGTDLPALLNRLASISPALKFKLFTIFPSLYLQYASQLEPFFASHRIPYVCLPVQSAAPRILELMNRSYDPDLLADAIATIRFLDPEAYIYSHFIYNFPTETREELELSVAFSRCFDHCVFIAYGENSATRAAGITPKVSRQECDARTVYLKELIRQKRLTAFLVPQT